MAYTQTQLETAFKNAAIGTTPTTAQSLALQAFATQNASGQLTDAQALSQTINLAANSTTDVSVGAYQFFLGFAPSVAGLTVLNGAYTGTGAQVGLNGENRFISEAVALATQNTDAKAAFTASYGSLTFAQATAAAYNIIIGNPAAAAAGVNVDAAVAFLSSDASKAYYTAFIKANTGLTAAADIELAVKAAIVGEIMFIATNYNNGAGLGSYASSTNNLVVDLSDDGKLTADNAAGINLFTSYPANTVGTVFNLTAAVETTTGTAANDTFNASLGIDPATGNATVETLTSLDVINGGAGIDTLNVTSGKGTLAQATLSGIEVLNITSDFATYTADVSGSNFTGLTTLSLKDTTVGALVVTTKGNVTSATVTGSGASTVGITDSAATDVLASASVTGVTSLVTVTSDALTSLSLTNATGGATAVVAGAHALGVTLNGVTAGTITDATATTLSVGSTGSKVSGVTLTAAAATTVNLSATGVALGLTDVNIGAATKVIVTGDSAVTIAATTAVGALTSIDSSASTGGITITPALGDTVLFTGGAGKDSVSVAATYAKALTTGGGNDTVTLTGATVVGSVDAGTGTDVLSMTAANAITASGGTAFAALVKGFETLKVAAVAAAGTITVSNLNDKSTNAIDKVILAANTESLIINGLASGNTVEFTGGVAATKSTTVGITNSAVSTTDVLNVSITAAAGLDLKVVDASNVETVKFLTDDSATTATGIAHTATLTDTAATTITVAGDAGLALTFTGTALTSFDASGVTKGAVTWTSGNLAAAATVVGGTGANTFDFTATTKVVTYTGGAGVDTITGGSAADVINTGAGADVVTLGAGVNVVNLGDGNDAITLGTGASQVTLGAGTDTVTVIAPTSGSTYATITDIATGDVLKTAGATSFNATKISINDTAVFQDFLDNATAGNATHAVSWFQYAGNTYVVEDVAAGSTFSGGADIVVKLTGLVDLSTATFAAGAHTLTLG